MAWVLDSEEVKIFQQERVGNGSGCGGPKKRKEGLANPHAPVRPRANKTLLEGWGSLFFLAVWISCSGAIQPLFGPAMGNKARIKTKPDPSRVNQTINSIINKESRPR